MVREALTLSISFPLYPSMVVITANTRGSFAVKNSVQVSSPGSDVPEEAPLASYLYQWSCGNKGRNKYCAKSASLRGRDAVAVASGKGIRRGTCNPHAVHGRRGGGSMGVCCVDTMRLQPDQGLLTLRKARGSGQMFCQSSLTNSWTHQKSEISISVI